MTSKTLAFSAITVVLTALAWPTACQAALTVDSGFDLFQTDPGSTVLFGEHFEGVPLGTFNFDSTIGVRNVGLADTIIRRVGTASVPNSGLSDTVFTVVDAFQLRTVSPVSYNGGPLGIYYLTLSSRSGGQDSVGTMTINFGSGTDPAGTFSSSFDLFLDVRFGSLNGTIVDSKEIQIADSGAVPWRHAPPTGSVQIPGVNVDLNGSSSANDFWIEGPVSKTLPHGSIGSHNASAPDVGSTLALLSLALGGLGWTKAATGAGRKLNRA